MNSNHILEMILEATPRDEWVMGNEIAEKTGLTAKAVGSIIGYNLLQYIERKRPTDKSNRVFLYKRIN
jgi:hypothetical protein